MTALIYPGPYSREHCDEAIEICRKGQIADAGNAFMRDFWRGLERGWAERRKAAK